MLALLHVVHFVLLGEASAALCRYEWWLKDHIVNYLHPNLAMQKNTTIPEEYRSAGQYMNAAYRFSGDFSSNALMSSTASCIDCERQASKQA